MKEIFIGSSNEAKSHAERIAAALSDVPNVKAVLWDQVFEIGTITFNVIEAAADRFAGAVILATPDDLSRIRDREVRVPRANVLFEYGYLVAKLTRRRVALCRWDGVDLPSDFAGLTHVLMGPFVRDAEIPVQARSVLKRWAENLTLRVANVDITAALPPTPLAGDPCPLTNEEEESFLSKYVGWRIVEIAKEGSAEVKREFYKRFEFPTYSLAWNFMCEVDKRGIQKLDHHPRWQNYWKCLDVWLSTSNLGGKPSCRDLQLAEVFEDVWKEFLDARKLT